MKDEYLMEEELIDLEEENNNPEHEKPDPSDIKKPFDPKKIDITQELKSIDILVKRIRNSEIDLNTDFQRAGNLWKPEVQSRLIESLLLRFPLPAFYFDASNDDEWLVVDGLQRLWTFKNFIVDKSLKLCGLEIWKDLEGSTFDDLNRVFQRRIEESSIATFLIKAGTPKEVKYNVFRRINTGGLMLNPQEIRNALNQGKPSQYLKEIAKDQKFTKFIKIRTNRMEDKELILRYLSFKLTNYSDYQKPLTDFLDKTMEKINLLDRKQLESLKVGLFKALEIAHELFGVHLFSRSIISDRIRRKFNSALFEVWTTLLSELGENEASNILKNKRQLIEKYRELLGDDEFYKYTSSSTSSKNSVNNRFSLIEQLIDEFK